MSTTNARPLMSRHKARDTLPDQALCMSLAALFLGLGVSSCVVAPSLEPTPTSAPADTVTPPPTRNPTPLPSGTPIVTIAPTKASLPGRRILPGFSATDLISYLDGLGLGCIGPYEFDIGFSWDCTYAGPDFTNDVLFEGPSATAIDCIIAGTSPFGPPTDITAHALPFLSAIASMPYAGAQPQQASAWVSANLSQIPGPESFLREEFGTLPYYLYRFHERLSLYIGCSPI